jgi:4-amino-4-deoxy-L-arabinose transferase-like glycosyltransferase
MKSRPLTRLGAILAILFIAMFVRLWQLDSAPPGLQHDEIFKAVEGRLVAEQGDWRVFYPSNQGHEGGYVWLLGLAYALFGHSFIMIKFPAFVCGMLTVALLYRVAANAYGYRIGLLASGMAAVSFWTVFTSRVGLRAVSLPLVTLAVLWGLWSVCFARPKGTGRRWKASSLTGIVLGFAIYTYTSSFVIYAVYAVFLLGLGLIDRITLKKRWPELLFIGLVGVVMTLPMVRVRLTNDQGLNRVSTITRPWDEFKEGRPDELIDNAKRLIGMTAFTGDPEWRYNIADRPLFLLPVGLLVYAGLGLLAWQVRRKPFNLLLIALVILGLIPSLLTVSAPSFLRSIITMPGIMIFIAVAVDRLGRLFRSYQKQAVWGIGVAAIVITAAADWPAYFDTWANHPEVHKIYRDDLEQLARYLQTHEEPMALVSTPNSELDPGIYSFSNPPATESSNVVFFNGSTNITLTDSPALLFVSPLAPITPPHADWLTEATGTQYLGQLLNQSGDLAFDIYRLNALTDGLQGRIEQVSQEPVFVGPPDAFPSDQIADWGTVVDFPVNFGDLLQLVGVDIPRHKIFSTEDGVNIQLYLRPLVDRSPLPLNIYVHLLRLDGTVAAQRDLMGVPPPQWSSETVFIQDNYVIGGTLQPGRYILAMGLYNWSTGERSPVLDESRAAISDRLILTEIDVVAR